MITICIQVQADEPDYPVDNAIGLLEDVLDWLRGLTSQYDVDIPYPQQETFRDEFSRASVSIEEGEQAEHVIQIEVKGGVVIDVHHLPPGISYRLIDHDLLEIEGGDV